MYKKKKAKILKDKIIKHIKKYYNNLLYGHFGITIIVKIILKNYFFLKKNIMLYNTLQKIYNINRINISYI